MTRFPQQVSVNIDLSLPTNIMNSAVDVENQCSLFAMDMLEGLRVLTVEVLDFLYICT